jgi:serine/threonine-protein phosphatase 2A regulatory subunit B'
LPTKVSCFSHYLFYERIGNKKTQQVDPDEDEPHLEEAWPHL